MTTNPITDLAAWARSSSTVSRRLEMIGRDA